MQNLDYLFVPELRFGVRGCRFLWREMKLKCGQMGEIRNAKELKERLYSLFFELTGYKLEKGEFVYVKKYDNGIGNSAGLVSPTWWEMIGLPVLITRFTEGKSPSNGEAGFLKEKIQEYIKWSRSIPFPNKSGESQ